MASTGRNQVVTLLAGMLPTSVVVMPYARSIDVPSRPVVMVRVDSVHQGPVQGTRFYDIALILVPTRSDPGPADDELDDLLETVLDALETNSLPNSVVLGPATRATFDNNFPAYEVTITVAAAKE